MSMETLSEEYTIKNRILEKFHSLIVKEKDFNKLKEIEDGIERGIKCQK